MLITHTLESVYQTGAEMGRLACTYREDLRPWEHWTAEAVQKMIREIPYIPDPLDSEFVCRPGITLAKSGSPCDCDDKSTVVGSWLCLKGIPFRFIAAAYSSNCLVSHVFTQAIINNAWTNFDATYTWHRIGQPKNLTAAQIIFTWSGKE